MKITHEDFKRADRFLLGSAKDTWNGDIAYRWLDEGESLAYRHQDGEGTEFRRVDTRSGRMEPLFDHAAMAVLLSRLLQKEVDSRQLPIKAISATNGEVYTLIAEDKTIVCDLGRMEARTQEAVAPSSPLPSVAPAGGHEVRIRDHNLWIKSPGCAEKAVTHAGRAHFDYGGMPESSAVPIFLKRAGVIPPPALVWSPDGRKFVYHRIDERHVAEMFLLQAVPDDGSFQIGRAHV